MNQSSFKKPEPSASNNRSYPLTLLEEELLNSSSLKNKLLLARNVNENIIINITSIHKYTLSGYVKSSAGESEKDEYNKLDFSHGYLRTQHSEAMKSIRFNNELTAQTQAIPNPPLPLTLISQYLGVTVEVCTGNGYIIPGKILAVEKYLTKMNMQDIPIWVFNHAIQEMRDAHKDQL